MKTNMRSTNTRKFVFLHNRTIFFTFGLGGDVSIAKNLNWRVVKSSWSTDRIFCHDNLLSSEEKEMPSKNENII